MSLNNAGSNLRFFWSGEYSLLHHQEKLEWVCQSNRSIRCEWNIRNVQRGDEFSCCWNGTIPVGASPYSCSHQKICLRCKFEQRYDGIFVFHPTSPFQVGTTTATGANPNAVFVSGGMRPQPIRNIHLLIPNHLLQSRSAMVKQVRVQTVSLCLVNMHSYHYSFSGVMSVIDVSTIIAYQSLQQRSFQDHQMLLRCRNDMHILRICFTTIFPLLIFQIRFLPSSRYI